MLLGLYQNTINLNTPFECHDFSDGRNTIVALCSIRESDSVTCSAKPADLTSICTFVVSARTRHPGRLSFLRQPRLPLLHHTTELPQMSHHNRCQRLQRLTGFPMVVLILRPGCNHNSECRYSTPFSSSMTYGLLSQTSRVALVMYISAPNFCA